MVLHVFLAMQVGVQLRRSIQGSPFGLVLEEPHGLDVLQNVSRGPQTQNNNAIEYHSRWSRQ